MTGTRYKSSKTTSNTTTDQPKGDRRKKTLFDTVIESQNIKGLKKNNDIFLCFPQLIKSVLKHIPLGAIHEACFILNIKYSTCDFRLKKRTRTAGAIDSKEGQCSFIRRKDAERLCNFLLQNEPPPLVPSSYERVSHVYHEHFGGCEGMYVFDMDAESRSKCIQCKQCSVLLSAPRFLCHSHDLKSEKKDLPHDPSRWDDFIFFGSKGIPLPLSFFRKRVREILSAPQNTDLTDNLQNYYNRHRETVSELCSPTVQLKTTSAVPPNTSKFAAKRPPPLRKMKSKKSNLSKEVPTKCPASPRFHPPRASHKEIPLAFNPTLDRKNVLDQCVKENAAVFSTTSTRSSELPSSDSGLIDLSGTVLNFSSVDLLSNKAKPSDFSSNEIKIFDPSVTESKPFNFLGAKGRSIDFSTLVDRPRDFSSPEIKPSYFSNPRIEPFDSLTPKAGTFDLAASKARPLIISATKAFDFPAGKRSFDRTISKINQIDSCPSSTCTQPVSKHPAVPVLPREMNELNANENLSKELTTCWNEFLIFMDSLKLPAMTIT